MTAFLSRTKASRASGVTLAAVLAYVAAGAQTAALEIQSGLVAFEATTNMPGVEVKGKSTALSAHAEAAHDNRNLVLQQIRATLPVRTLATGMKVRDEHMRKYIFTTADGNEPDLQFTSEPVVCSPATPREFNCPIAGFMSIRGVARPFGMQLRVKEQGASAFRAAGDAVVKLSDYGIDPPSQFGVKPGNEVKFHIEVTGKQKPADDNKLGGIE